ncbi:MAG: translation initiation factor IF-2 [Pseudomonadota bacterium]
MSDVTVKQLAEVVKTPVDKLLEQLKDAGVEKQSADDVVTDDQKMQLLSHLRQSHGKQGSADEGAPKITLKRKKVSELNVGSGRDSKKVNVEVRKKRTYVSRQSIVEEEERRQRAEEEARAAEAQAQVDADEAVQAAAEAKAAAEAEAEAATRAADEAQQAAEAAEAAEAVEAAEAAEAAEVEAAIQAEAELQAEPESEPEAEAEHEESPRARREHEEQSAREAAEERVRREQEELAAKAAENIRRERERKAKLRERGGEGGDKTRYGRKELHVDRSKVGRRGKKAKRGRDSGAGSGTQIEQKHGFEMPVAPVVHDVYVPETISVGDLAKEMAVKGAEVVKNLMKMGVMTTINQTLDQDTAMLVVEEMGHNPIAKDEEAETEQQLSLEVVNDSELVSRPPVVTIMGHVDHGKTSLLDYIRKSKVTDGEAGGITQHIGAYHVETDNGIVSFLDTPGHAAFTAMRARGAQVTDVVILVVAADDGVMPQTIEAVQHAKAAGVPLIVAVNKMDKPEADPDRVKNELSQQEVIPEDWGGENIFVHVSAMTGDGVDQLLESVLLQSELLELKAPAKGPAEGVVVESSLDKGRGPVATVLVRSGELKRGDTIVTGKEFGRVRAMFDENGNQVESAGPSIPVQVLGLSGTPNAGDDVVTAVDERKAREIVQLRQEHDREQRLAHKAASKMEEAFNRMAEGKVETVNVLIKCDVQGSVEALRDSLIKLSTDEVKLNVVGASVGGISETDALLAAASNAFVIGFNVRADSAGRRAIEEQDIQVKYYNVIYDVIDDVKAMMSGMLSPELKENIIGLAEVRDVFKASNFGAVAGCLVVEGVVRRSAPIRVLRENVVIYEGELESLRRFKDDVNEVKVGTECGIAVKNYNDVKPGDQIEVYERIEVERTLD